MLSAAKHLPAPPAPKAAAVCLVLLGARAAPAMAHTGAVAPGELWSAWSWEPAVLIGLGVGAFLYARGTERLWARAGRGRGVRRWQLGAFATGVIILLIALVSPLDALGATLFTAHMVQHQLLILVAAPLLVLGAPLVPLLWALPMRWRRVAGRWARLGPVRAGWRGLTHPLAAWLLYSLAVLLWHAPPLYQAAVTNDLLHAVQHASFLAAALLFWWVLLHPRSRGVVRGAGAVLYLFTTGLYSGLLGAFLTFAPAPWYPIYADRTRSWGLSPLDDQQLGGLLMWLPGSIVYLIVALALLASGLRSLERRVGRAERVRHVRAERTRDPLPLPPGAPHAAPRPLVY